MTTVVPTLKKSELVYPSADGEPVAETYDHVYAIFTTLTVLKQYLVDRRASVLANQFLYYAQGFPKVRVAPDVMVIFDVEPGGRDNYKIWEEGQVPKVIFEMTSPGTKSEDIINKKDLYEGIEVQEYWLFDPKGEWIPEQLRGRMFALLRTLMQSGNPLGGAIAGLLLPVLGMTTMIALSALVTGIPGLLGYQVITLRRAGSPAELLEHTALVAEGERP